MRYAPAVLEAAPFKAKDLANLATGTRIATGRSAGGASGVGVGPRPDMDTPSPVLTAPRATVVGEGAPRAGVPGVAPAFNYGGLQARGSAYESGVMNSFTSMNPVASPAYAGLQPHLFMISLR